MRLLRRGKIARRSWPQLADAVQRAKSDAEKAVAHFNLGLFHDNNGREAEAIPRYEAALTLGLDRSQRPYCLAWLASSLYKTGRLAEGLGRRRRGGATLGGRGAEPVHRGAEEAHRPQPMNGTINQSAEWRRAISYP